MIDTQEIQVNAIIAELRTQRDHFGDRAANLAAELAVAKAENALLEGQVRSLEEQLNSQSCDVVEENSEDGSETPQTTANG